MAYFADPIGSYRSHYLPPFDSCTPPPANPNDPMFRLAPQIERGPNNLTVGIQGPDPLLVVGGSHDQQEFQRDSTLALGTLALSSYASGHLPGAPRFPSDGEVRRLLGTLNPNPPIGTSGAEVTRAVYQSNIPNASPQQAYEHFVNHPEEVFSAGGMEIRPPTERLVDGGRYMPEIGGPVPTWLPVEIRLDPTKNAVTILTLDGHVLRGEQTFTFTSDCNGDTVLTQDARFQASSNLAGEVQQLASIAEGQHQTWQFAHREMYEQFNGDRHYRGMGTSLLSSQQLSTWSETLRNLAAHPGRSSDAVIDAGGEFVNAGYDFGGRLAHRGINRGGDLLGDALDRFGVPGGTGVRQGSGTIAGVTHTVADRTGDVASGVIDKGGDAVGHVVDFVTPW